MQKKNKEFENFDAKVKDLLKEFQRNRQWADIGNWLSRAQPLIAANKFSDFPHKINMAKRLAQCLNVSLPAGIHSGALALYNTILSNFGNKSHLLPLMSIGLFPFFEYSSSTLKLQLLNIFESHFISDHQCVQMIVSLMNTLLTGLNENNQELARKIYALCDKISEKYGRIWVDGAVWVNILKSPKVRVAGFKYFMKSFKDRDKQIKNAVNMEGEEKIEKEQVEFIKNEQQLLNELTAGSDAEIEFTISLLKVKELEDDYRVRFPNFSSLVVHALSACLSITQTDNFARRAALDMMIFYLKLEKSEFMNEKDTIHLLSSMLQIIKLKQYSLTRRIYTYLFGQPDMQGHYHINLDDQSYEMKMFLKSLEGLLKNQENAENSHQEGVLVILQILLKDHEELNKVIIPALAYKILKFLRNCTLPQKNINEFFSNIIHNQTSIFITACLKQIVLEEQIANSQLANDTIKTIEYFYFMNLGYEPQESHDSDICRTIQGLLKYLQITNCQDYKNSQQILNLCLKLIKSSQKSVECISAESLQTLDYLIDLKPRHSIYGGLLTIHPSPSKESLLPYINETSLSLVCISNLLKIKPEEMQVDQRKSLFFAIFNLLNCHMWQQTAIEFIQNYKSLYEKEFQTYINEVQPTEWLIYWKKMYGGFSEGVVRMLKNLDNENPLLKNISKKWILGSKTYIGKIVDCIYFHIETPPEEKSNQEGLSLIEIYRMLQNIFNIMKDEFVTYFFIQKEKYLVPLIDHIYESLQGHNDQLKSQSLSMLQFLLQKANKLEEKIAFLQLTLSKTIKALRITFKQEEYLREIQILSFFKSVADIFPSFKGHKDKSESLKRLLQENQLFAVLSEGMRQTKVGYVRTLYMELLQSASETMASFCQDRQFISESLTIVFEKLFIMLRENDVTQLEQIIRGRSNSSMNRRKKSDMGSTYQKMNNVTDTQFNVQVKYAQVIELWGLIKFFVKISIENKIHDLPITQLLSLILQSFPFSYLKYDQISAKIITDDYEALQEEIRNVTGLKKEVLQIFETLWENYEDQIINYLIDKGDPRVLIHGKVDPNAVVKAIYKSQCFRSIVQYNKPTNFSLSKSTLHFNIEILEKQNRVSYFFYLYIMYCNLTLIKQKKNASFYSHILTLIKNLRDSWHIQTKLWVIEILYCISIRIPFRDIHMDIHKTRQQFQDLLKDVLDDLRHVIIKTKSFTHRKQIKTGLFNIFSKEEKEESLYDFLKIYPPTIFKHSEEYGRKNKNKNTDHVFHIENQTDYFLFTKSSNQGLASFIEYLSIVTIKTFIQIYCKLLIFIFQQDMNKITPIIKDHLSSMISLVEPHKTQNYIQNLTEFISEIFNSPSLKNQMIKLMRKSILDMYNGEDFFKCTKKTLKHWKYIVDVCSDGQDLLGQLLEEKLFEGIFTRKAEQTRLKIKNFERVCFLIYAGRIDKYQNKLRTVLESLIEVMKEENPSPALLILILFCIRILLIRLSENTLNRIFRSIWPSLIALLIQIFTKDIFAKNSNLLLAGLKVIELVHALQLEEFNIHKWIFIFDYFGIRIDSQTEDEQRKHGQEKILTPFTFQPIMTRVLPANNLKCTYIPEQLNDTFYEVCKRKLVIKESNVDSEQELRNHGFILLQYMMDLNQKRVYTVKQEIEDLIQGDFISLDDYIFQSR